MKLFFLMAAPGLSDASVRFSAWVKDWSAAIVNAFLYFAPVPLFFIITGHALYVLIAEHVTAAAIDACVGSLVDGYIKLAVLSAVAATYKARVAALAAAPTPAAQVPGLSTPMVQAATKIEQEIAGGKRVTGEVPVVHS